MAVAPRATPDHLALQNAERSEKRRRSVRFVIVGHCASAPLLHGQAGLNAVEGMYLRLLIDGRYDGMRR